MKSMMLPLPGGLVKVIVEALFVGYKECAVSDHFSCGCAMGITADGEPFFPPSPGPSAAREASPFTVVLN